MNRRAWTIDGDDDSRIDQSGIFDVIDGRRGEPQGRYIWSWLLLILQVLLVIVYIYSVVPAHPAYLSPSLPPLPPSQPSIFASTPQDRGERIKRERKREREKERERRVYLQAHKATIRDIKMSGEGKGGRLKVEAAWNRLIKNYFDWCNRRDRHAIKRRDNFRWSLDEEGWSVGMRSRYRNFVLTRKVYWNKSSYDGWMDKLNDEFFILFETITRKVIADSIRNYSGISVIYSTRVS